MRNRWGVKEVAITGVLFSLCWGNGSALSQAYIPPPHKPIVLTLKDVVLLSIRNNPNFEQAEIGRISQKFALVLAKYQFQPQVTLTGSAQYTNTVSNSASSYSKEFTLDPSVALENHYGTEFTVASTNNISGDDNYNPSLEFQVVQPLIQGFGKPVVDATLNNAKDNELINKLNFKNSAITTITQTITDYFSLVQSYQTLAVDKVTLKNYQQTVKNDEALIAAGQMARSEIVQAQAQVVGQESTITSTINSINTAKNQLLNDLGLPPRTPITVPKKFEFQKVEHQLVGGKNKLPNLNESTEVALGNNLAYQVLAITIRTLWRSLLQAEDTNRWQLNLTASETVGGGSGGGDNAGLESMFNGTNHEEQAGLNLTVPIDNVSAQSDIINQKVALDQAIIALHEGKRSLIETIQTDYSSVLSNEKALELAINALKLQEETVYIAEQKQIAGQMSTFEVITDQQNLSTQQQTVVDSEITYLNSIVTLEKDMGVALEPWRIKMKY